LDNTSLCEFIIICKANEKSFIETELFKQKYFAPIRLISENSILKEFIIKNTEGWYIQQLLKLGIARYIKTNFYLVLDSDCFLTKPFGYDNLFSDQQLLTNSNSWKIHKNWWISSAKILDIPVKMIQNQPVMGVTPQTLITSYVSELLSFLSSKTDHLEWDEYLCTRKFTEFSLYWLFLIKSGSTNRYLTNAKPKLLGNGLWRSTYRNNFPLAFQILPNTSNKEKKINDFVGAHIQKTFDENDDYYFSLVQSNINQISVECIANCVDNYFKE